MTGFRFSLVAAVVVVSSCGVFSSGSWNVDRTLTFDAGDGTPAVESLPLEAYDLAAAPRLVLETRDDGRSYQVVAFTVDDENDGDRQRCYFVMSGEAVSGECFRPDGQRLYVGEGWVLVLDGSSTESVRVRDRGVVTEAELREGVGLFPIGCGPGEDVTVRFADRAELSESCDSADDA